MTKYKIYCGECSEEFSFTGESSPKYCCMCGEEVSDTDTVNETSDEDAEWDRISNEVLDDIDDWKD